MNTTTRILKALLSVGTALALVTPAMAGNILIINGASNSVELSTTNAITSNLSNVLIAAGNTASVVDGMPQSFAGYSQVWDLRFSNAGALTGGDTEQYLAYLQGGGGVFLMGENGNFMARNNSILGLIAAAGGGLLEFQGFVNGVQSVHAPFNGSNPTAVDTVVYAAAGGVNSAGSGTFITSADGVGTGVAFGVNTLSNASAGSLTTIFDVNFMQGTFDQPASQNLLINLAQFVADEVEPPVDVPEPAGLAIFGLGLACLRVLRRKGCNTGFNAPVAA